MRLAQEKHQGKKKTLLSDKCPELKKFKKGYEKWTNQELIEWQDLVLKYGRDFRKIAECLKTKSET